jgi:hypothetical protein
MRDRTVLRGPLHLEPKPCGNAQNFFTSIIANATVNDRIPEQEQAAEYSFFGHNTFQQNNPPARNARQFEQNSFGATRDVM